MTRRRTVKCWYCGNKKRRLPGLRSLAFFDLTRSGRLRVVGRRQTVQPYGVCNADRRWERCAQVMLLPEDVQFVLRAAIQHERRGGNCMSEYDL